MLWLKLAIDRMLGSIMRRITTHWHEWPWRDPGASLRNENSSSSAPVRPGLISR